MPMAVTCYLCTFPGAADKHDQGAQTQYQVVCCHQPCWQPHRLLDTTFQYSDHSKVAKYASDEGCV